MYWNFIIHQIFPEFLQPLRDLRIHRVVPFYRGFFLFGFWISSSQKSFSLCISLSITHHFFWMTLILFCSSSTLPKITLIHSYPFTFSQLFPITLVLHPPCTNFCSDICPPPVAVVTNESLEFQVRNVPGFDILDGQNCRGAFACLTKSQEFFCDDLDVSIRMPIDIDWNIFPSNRATNKLDSEHSSLCESCPTSLKPCKNNAWAFAQRLPFRAHFQSGRYFSSAQRAELLLEFLFDGVQQPDDRW